MNAMHWPLFEQLDQARRAQGAMIDAAGLGPVQAPSREIHAETGLTVREYEGNESEPIVLIIPAPIKRPYIWDLLPEASAVRRCLDAGARVLLADWQPAPREFCLADYADRLIGACLDAARAERAVLLGHSLGGLFAAIFAALHPERVRGLGVIASPLGFGAAAPAIAALVAPLADEGEIPDQLPGSFLAMASAQAAPRAFNAERMLDALLSAGDPARLRTHWLVERWALDEFPLPRQLLSELSTRLVREDRFLGGTLEVNGRRIGPADVAAPLLCVHDPLCELVPPTSVLPFVEAAASRDKTVLAYERDVGVGLQHLGPLIGRNAHARLWPQIVEWLSSSTLTR